MSCIWGETATSWATQGTSDALLVAHLMASSGPNGQPLVKDGRSSWKLPPSMPDLRTISATRSGETSWSRPWARKTLAEGVNREVLTKIAKQLKELRGPRILSDVVISPVVFDQTKEELLDSTKGFRIFGQRFTFDAWRWAD